MRLIFDIFFSDTSSSSSFLFYRALSLSRRQPGLFKKRVPSSSHGASGNASRNSSNDAFRNRFANDESLDVEDDGVPREGRRPPLYEHHPPEPPRRQTTTVSIEDEREILEAAARAGIRINGRVPEVGDFFTGEPVPTRTRRHRRWIRKRRENEKEALRRRGEAEEEVVAGAAARAYGLSLIHI